ncbi:MAG: hypothetical protein ABSA13_09705 [Beijerinckiaceae bacterium]|jgi:hypothetical protein
MTQNPTETGKLPALATYADVKGALGDMDDATMTAILALRPAIADIEEASMWLSGDMDVFGPGRPLKDVPGQIVALLTPDEEENAPRAR